uniref:BEACH domain-containing protein n=1 Tax=Caenorhabditis japonica TaxID=281687 RepID=A0A8R1HZW0_CAEJA
MDQDQNTILSLFTDFLTNEELNHGVLYFEPFRSHEREDAIKVLKSECGSDRHKEEVFKYNMTELFKKHYDQISSSPVGPNNALLERIKITLTNGSADYSELEGRIFENDNEQCYAVMHIASYVVRENDLFCIQLAIPPSTTEKSIDQIFLDYEITILRFLNLVTTGTSATSSRLLADFDGVLKSLIEGYNSKFESVDNRELRHSCVQSAAVLIECFWMITSKFLMEDNTTYRNIINTLKSIECPVILHSMMQFWINFPICPHIPNRRFYHHTLMVWIIPKHMEIDNLQITMLISKHRLQKSGVIPKTFTLYHALQNKHHNFIEMMLGSFDPDNFPSHEISEAKLKEMQEREYEELPFEQFESMWESIIVNSIRKNTTIRKIMIRAIISDFENQIFSDFKLMKQLSKQYLVEFANRKFYEQMIHEIKKRTLPDASAAGISSEVYKLIVNLQLHHFSHFVNLSTHEAENCFNLILEIFTNVPEFENTRTPYEVLSCCFQNACLYRNLELRNLMAQGIVEVLENISNFHALEYFLTLLAKVLRSHSSEELMRKNIHPHKRDPLIRGVKQIMLNVENLENFYEEDKDDSSLELFCKIHLTCLFILTFCDQTYVFSPLDMWFTSIDRILELDSGSEQGDKLKSFYSNLITRRILTSSSSYPVPQGQLLETVRNATPLFFLSWTPETSQQLIKNLKGTYDVSKFLQKNNSLIQLSSCNNLPMLSFALHRLNTILERGVLIPHLAHRKLKNYSDSEVGNRCISHIHSALKLSWSGAVQHEDMEYITHVVVNPKMSINVYLQFKIRDELDGSECIKFTIGKRVVMFTCTTDSISLQCLYETDKKEKFLDLQTPLYKVHTIMLRISNTGDKIDVITYGKAHTLLKSDKSFIVDEIKISVNSLHHTIPLIFQGDFQSLVDVHEIGISSKNIENARKFTLITKGRKLNIGQIFHPVIPIRHSQTISLYKEQPGFENAVQQLRSAGGFGFIFYSFTNMFLEIEHNVEKVTAHWELLLTYLSSPYIESEKFSRLEAIRMTSLLFRFDYYKIPEQILQKIFDICMTSDSEIKEAVFLTELLSESIYWEHDLTMFYRLLVRFKSTKPGANLDKLLPLILQIVAKIIKNDTGSEEVHDIVTIMIEIFKEWCRSPHSTRTNQLVTFMMDLFDFEKISPHHEQFRWIEDSVLERELSRQPVLVLNGGEPVTSLSTKNLSLLQLDLPFGNYDDDEFFSNLSPANEPHTNNELRIFTRNRDYMMKGLLQILLQSYILCPDSQYDCFDSITAERICFLIEVNNNGKVIGALVEMYEAIINHNIYSDKITQIFQLDLLRVLARQLHGKPPTLQAVNALFSILLREQVDVSAGLDTSHLEAFSPNAISCQCVYPLLTVLEETVDEVDISVFTVVCTSLNKVYIYNNQLTQAMTVAGLDESMTAILLKLARLGDFRTRNEKLKSLLDPWFAFAVSIVRVGVNGRNFVFEGAARFISHLLLLYSQENGKLLDNPESAAQRLLRDNIYWALCVLLLQLFKFLLDIALADSNKHRSASNSSLHMLGYEEEADEIDVNAQKPTKFWDEIAQKVKESVMGPNHNMFKSPYRKHKDTPLSAEEMRHRIKDVLVLCQNFFKLTTRVESDEEENLYRIFFEEISRWVLDEIWPSSIWIASDMMFITNIYANCVAFVMTDIHQYMSPFSKVCSRQKLIRMEFMLQKIIRSQQKIATVFGNIMDIDQMMKLTMENITQREDHNSVIFKLAVLFLNSPTKSKGSMNYPHPRTPDLIQRMTVESEIASRFWLDQRNEVIRKTDLRSRTPEYQCDVLEINNSLEKLQKTLSTPRNVKRVNEICELMQKIDENERVFSRLSLVKNNHKPRKITTILGPRGERMITDVTDIKTKEMFAVENASEKTSKFREIFEILSCSRIRKQDVFARYTCLHGVLITNGVQTNPIFQLHRSGITALPCGSHLFEKTYLFEDMTMIFRRPMRPWDALDVSFEILLKNHQTILIFSQQRLAKFLLQHASKLIATENHLMTVTKQWEEGKTSNFEYIMMLNLFAGRTVHDSSNYPVFPRVIAKFGDHEIDLLDKSLYRKLDRPVAAQDAASVEKHKEHYNELRENEEVSRLAPYHFGSMCSNRGIVSFFNIRLLHFGEEAIELQDGRFDFPDRLFHNVESGLGLGKIESGNDYKELVPELFTTVEVLRNENGNLFGERQNGEEVGDVEVPMWCFANGIPHHEFFIQVHRQALESEHVQSMLHHWIDLIFGYKARGKAALEATNVYHPAVYPGSSPPSGFDSLLTNAYEANQKTLGSAPNQLFNQPHPKRELILHRHGSVRNMHGLAFGKELTAGAYEVGEFTIERHPSQRVWRRMKNLKMKIFNKTEKGAEPIQLFKRIRDRKEKDPTDLIVKVRENVLILSDGSTETTTKHTRKVIDVSVDEQYVACLIQQGPIELYKMLYKTFGKSRIAVVRNENKILSTKHYGTLPIQNGHYLSVDVCTSFSTVFTIHKTENNSCVSVWDLHSHHIRATCIIEGIMESCGLIKNLGDLVVSEMWNGEQVRYEKQWRTKRKASKKKKYCGKTKLTVTEQTIAKINVNAKPYLSKYVSNNQFVHSGVISMPPEPAMGIQTLAMIRNDNAIVLFETLSLTQMRVLEVDNGPGYCLRELRYQDDNTLIALYKENRSLRKKNRELYKNLGCAPPTRTWMFKPK